MSPLKFTTQTSMAVFCFCSKLKPIYLSKTEASSVHESRLCKIATVEFEPSPKIYYTTHSCPLSCLHFITEEIQITSPAKYGAFRKPDYAQICLNLFCPKRSCPDSCSSLSLVSSQTTAVLHDFSQNSPAVSSIVVFCLCSKFMLISLSNIIPSTFMDSKFERLRAWDWTEAQN